jgi:UDP-N-acetyl-2-amino-2-deoxyglucuronate dehydrogenase
MKNFAVTGVAGYIAPRHLQAIHDTGNNLVAALDPHDSVGILDKWFNGVYYFKEFERFERHLEKLRRGSSGIDYLSICSPNYLHDAHIRLALRVGADAICEKPLVLNPWNCDALSDSESETGRKVNTILQLRLHPSVIALKEKYGSSELGKLDVELTYLTSRGPWYLYSWKADDEKSGGLVSNIGIHFFDMLMWIFGKVESADVYYRDQQTVSGILDLERARVRWTLSIDRHKLPSPEMKTFRSIKIGGEEVEFSDGFTDLHTEAYKQILCGNGFSVDDARPSIELVHRLRHAKVSS